MMTDTDRCDIGNSQCVGHRMVVLDCKIILFVSQLVGQRFVCKIGKTRGGGKTDRSGIAQSIDSSNDLKTRYTNLFIS